MKITWSYYNNVAENPEKTPKCPNSICKARLLNLLKKATIT